MTAGPPEWEVFIIKHGLHHTIRSKAFLNYDFYDEPDGPFELGYYLWALRNGDKIIHIDTGYTAKGAATHGRSVLTDPLEALLSLGFDPSAGNPLVITHAHYDHIGNLGAFTQSPVWISDTEFNFWTSDLGTRRLFAYFGDQDGIHALFRAKKEGRLRVYTGRHELAPGVELIEVGGHTPGQTMVNVQTAAGPVLLTSDAAHFHEELERDMLFLSMTDLPKSYRALDLIRGSGATIVTGHDADELDRFDPVDDERAGVAAVIGRRS